MRNQELADKILAAFAIAVGVVIVAIYAKNRPIETITLGNIAAIDGPHQQRKVRIINTGDGKLVGNYLIITSPDTTRLPVVIAIAGGHSMPDGCNAFLGYCGGVQDTEVAGLPVKPPFVLIADSIPIDRSE